MTDRLLTFVHICDTHIHADPTFTGDFVDFTSRAAVAEMIHQINTLPFPVDFVLHTGDIMTDPERPEDYLIARDLLSQIQAPVYYLNGNHDRVEALQRYLLGRDDAGMQAYLDYELEVNGVQVVCLDSCEPGTAVGRLNAAQLAWLDATCSPADPRPLIVALHHHPLASGAPWLDEIGLTNGEDLHQHLLPLRDRLRGVFYGHIHESMITVRDGIGYHSGLSGWFQTRTWFDQPGPVNDAMHEPGFNVVTLTAQDTFIRHHRFHIGTGLAGEGSVTS